jgi:hypothetical protein
MVQKLFGVSTNFVERFVLWKSEIDLFEVWEDFFVRFSFHIAILDHVLSSFPVIEKDMICVIVPDLIFELLILEFRLQSTKLVKCSLSLSISICSFILKHNHVFCQNSFLVIDIIRHVCHLVCEQQLELLGNIF